MSEESVGGSSMKSPKDKLDIDDYDELGEYISDAMDLGFTIEAEDFEGRPCTYCGETIPFTEWPEAVVTWDILVEGTSDFYARHYFCSDDCLYQAKRDEHWLRGEAKHGEADRLREEHLEGRV